MIAPVPFVLLVLGLIVSANARLNFTLLGQPVSISYLGLAIAVLMLALLALVLFLARSLIRDGLGLKPHMRTA